MTNLRKRRTVVTAVAAAVLMALPMAAIAAPSDRDIAAARDAESIAEMSVAQLEVGLATVRSEAQAAQVQAQLAAEDLNQANLDLEEARKTEDTAKAQAASALEAYEVGRDDLAAIVQEAHRSGTASLDSLAPYLSPDGLSDVESRQTLINSFGSAVDAKLQEVMALKQVADVMASTAEKARLAKEDAVAQVAAQADNAESTAEAAQVAQQQAEEQYEAMVAELAAKRNTTVELEKERQAALEKQQAEAAEAELKARADRLAAQAAAEAERNQSSGNSGSNNTPPPPAAPDPDPDPWTPPPSEPEPDPDPWTPPVTPPPPPPASGGVWGAIETAKGLLGAPYVWGGEGPGYDCSGLVTVAYRSVGVYLTHQSRSQYAETYQVSIGSARPGDLVFWSSNGAQSGIYHVAIYLGNDQIIEAPTFGVPVRITSIYNWGQVLPTVGRVL